MNKISVSQANGTIFGLLSNILKQEVLRVCKFKQILFK